jgi:hypothetical protein
MKDFAEQGENLETFLKKNYERYREEYELPALLMAVNVDKILEDNQIESEYFKQLHKAEYDLNNEAWNNCPEGWPGGKVL